MTQLSDQLRDIAERSLGPCDLISAVPGESQPVRVALFRDLRGAEYIAKHHTSEQKHRREVHAYRSWAPVLGGSAARLVSVDSQTMTILVTALPGRLCHDPGDTGAHRQAGALLRLLHDAEPPRPLEDFQHWLTGRVGSWREQAAGLLSASERRIIDQHLAALRMLGVPSGGVCHLDYQPRNWLLDHSRTLRVIDFEHTRLDLLARDFVRLHFRCWTARPDLRDAFFDGYGRNLAEVDQQAIRHCGAIDVLTALVRGRQTGDATMTAHGRQTLRQLQQRD